MDYQLPAWAQDLIVCPKCKVKVNLQDQKLHCALCQCIGRLEQGIVKFTMPKKDAAIEWYTKKGGTNFQERRKIVYAMSSLDTPIYHAILENQQPKDKNSVIIDVGAGDGRNTIPWLNWGYKKVIALDPVSESLSRLKESVPEEFHEHLLLIESDARALPLVSNIGDIVLTIETLAYLNEDYEQGLRECIRIAKSQSTLLVSERSWEGGILTHLLYKGVGEMVKLKNSEYVADGPVEESVRNRVFEEAQLLEMMQKLGLNILEKRGISAMSILLGYLRGEGKISEHDEKHYPEVDALLHQLSQQGKFRRAHVIIAKKIKI